MAGKDFLLLTSSGHGEAGHSWLGEADMVGRRNLWGYVARAAFTCEKWDFASSFFSFYRLNGGSSAYTFGGTTLGSSKLSDSKEIALELDTGLSYQALEKLKFSAGYSFFWLGNYLRQQFVDLEPRYFYAALSTEF